MLKTRYITFDMMNLRELRKQNKKTIAGVAKVLGVTSSALVNYESGVRSISLEQVLKLSEIYGESAEDIIKAQLSSRFDQEGNLQILRKGRKTF